MKIKIYTFVFNRPDLLEYQIKSIKKYLIGDIDINIVYDSRDENQYDEFKSVCDKYSVNFYSHRSDPGKTAGFYNGNSIDWAYNEIIEKDEDSIICFLDHDIFFIDEVDFNKELFDFDIISTVQNRGKIKYLWPGFTAFKLFSIKDRDFSFLPTNVGGFMLDSGGCTHTLFDNKNLKIVDTGVEYPEEYDEISLLSSEVNNGYPFELHLNRKLLHFRNASSWHNGYNVTDENKTNTLQKILTTFI